MKDKKINNKLQISNFKRLQGFTLLELLLVIAVIALLAGIILIALNPAQRLEDANSAKTVSKAQDIRKAVEAYAITNGGLLPTNITNLASYGLHDICKAGQSTNCVNLDALVSGEYISEIPIDDENDTTVISGYKLEYNPTKNNVQIFSYDNFIDYIEDGATLTNGLRGYWKMDEGSGTTVADASGNGHTANLVNLPTWGTGKYGNGISLDGTNDNVLTSNISGASTTAVTFSAWIKKNGNALDWTSPLQYTNSQSGFFIPPTGTSLRFQLGLVSAGLTSVDGTLDNNWHLWTGTWQSGSKIRLYKDGILATESVSNYTDTITTSSMRLGFYQSSGLYFNGVLDDVRVYNRALSYDEALVINNYAPPPVAQWKFDEGTGTVAADASGNGNTGTLTNGPTWTTGQYGGAVSFDGTNDHINVGTNELINIKAPITLHGWIKPQNLTGLHIITAKSGGSGTTTQYELRSNGTTLEFLTTSSGGVFTASGGTLTLNNWHFVVGTFDGISLKVFVDGVQGATTATFTGTQYTTSEPTVIGTRAIIAHSGQYFYSGQMDDVRIYNYAMTATQIQKAMNNEI